MKKVNLKILIPLIIGVVAIVGITVFLVSGKYGEDNTTSGNKILMESTMDTELDKIESTEKNTTDNGVQDTTPEEETTSKEVVPTTKEPETTPKPTEPPTIASKENVYVFNDDGTIDFKNSEINNYDEEFVNYVYQSNEVKNILGEKLYNSISYLGLSISSTRNKPAVCACINNEYWLVMHFDEDWNIHKGIGGLTGIYDPYDLPIKEDW